MKKFNYYESQISNIKNTKDPVTIKISDFDGNTTKHLTLNNESIEEMLKLFQKIKNNEDAK